MKYLIAGTGGVLAQIVRNELGCKTRSLELNLMQRCAASAEILPLPCPELVEFVERGELDSPALTAYLARQLGPYAGRVDAAVLGCLPR